MVEVSLGRSCCCRLLVVTALLPIAMQIICAMGDNDNERLKSIDPWEQISKSVQIRVSAYTRVIQISLAIGRRAFIANTSWFAFKYVPLNRKILNEPRGALTSKRFSSGAAVGYLADACQVKTEQQLGDNALLEWSITCLLDLFIYLFFAIYFKGNDLRGQSTSCSRSI